MDVDMVSSPHESNGNGDNNNENGRTEDESENRESDSNNENGRKEDESENRESDSNNKNGRKEDKNENSERDRKGDGSSGSSSSNGETSSSSGRDGSSRSTSPARSNSASSEDGSSRSTSPARANSASSEDESEQRTVEDEPPAVHRIVENESPSEEVNIDDSDEEENAMNGGVRSGRNEFEDANAVVDDEDVKITDSDDEREVKMADSEDVKMTDVKIVDSEDVKITDSDDEREEKIVDSESVKITDSDDEREVETVDSEDVKITDSDDEGEVKMGDSDNGEKDVDAESTNERNESIDDEEGEKISTGEDNVNEFIDNEEGDENKIVYSDEHRDVNAESDSGRNEDDEGGDEEDMNSESKSGGNNAIDDEGGDEEDMNSESKSGGNNAIDDEGEDNKMVDVEGDSESEEAGNDMEIEVNAIKFNEEVPENMAYDESEKKEQYQYPFTLSFIHKDPIRKDPIDDKEDESIDPSYYHPRFKPANYILEVINLRAKRPSEKVEEKRERTKREKNDYKPTKAVQHGIPHQKASQKGCEDEKKKESNKSGKGLRDILSTEKSIKDVAPKWVTSEQGPVEVLSTEKPNKDAAVNLVKSAQGPVHILSMENPNNNVIVNRVMNEQGHLLKTELKEGMKRPVEAPLMEMPPKDAESLSGRIPMNPVSSQPKLSVENKGEPKQTNKGILETETLPRQKPKNPVEEPSMKAEMKDSKKPNKGSLIKASSKESLTKDRIVATTVATKSVEGTFRKTEMKESKKPSKGSSIEALSKQSLTNDGIVATTVATEQELSMNSENTEAKQPFRMPVKTDSNETSMTDELADLFGSPIVNTVTRKRQPSLKVEEEKLKKPSNVATEISKGQTLHTSADHKAKYTRTDEGKVEHEVVRKTSEKEPNKPSKGTVGIPKKDIPQASKAEERRTGKNANEPRGLKNSETGPHKIPEKENPLKHREVSSHGPVLKSLTSNKAGPSTKHELIQERNKSQDMPKKTYHKDGSDTSQPKVKNSSQTMKMDEKLQNKVMNPPKIATKGGEIRFPIDRDKHEKKVEDLHEANATRKLGKKSTGTHLEAVDGDGEQLLEQGEISLSDEKGHKDASGEKARIDNRVIHGKGAGSEKPKTNNSGKRHKTSFPDCGDDCYKKYLKDVPDSWEAIDSIKTYGEYIKAFEKRYSCYELTGEQLSKTIKIFKELEQALDEAKSKFSESLSKIVTQQIMQKYQEEGTKYLQRKKAYIVLHRELDNLRTHLFRYFEDMNALLTRTHMT